MRALLLLLLIAPLGSLASGETPSRVRLLIPRNPFLRAADRTLERMVDEFNKSHPGIRIELLQRGDGYSSLKELVALRLAGDAPEIAAIEASEAPALASLSFGPKPLRTLPFRRTSLVLVVDQEVRVRAGLAPLPKDWNGLAHEATNLSRWVARERPLADARGLSIPLQGPQGLWIAEALTEKPLFRREAGGVKANSEARPGIERIQRLTEAPGVRSDETWERAIQAFVDRSSPMLVTSSDMLPWLKEQASFKWEQIPLRLPSGGTTQLVSGTDLVVTREAPGVREFLDYLYAPEREARWAAEGSFLSPLHSAEKARLRATDPDVVRIRSAWIMALRLLFGDASRRLPTVSVFNQMDAQALPR